MKGFHKKCTCSETQQVLQIYFHALHLYLGLIYDFISITAVVVQIHSHRLVATAQF